MIFTRCPGCSELAEVTEQFVLPSTDGPVEHVRTYCLNRHTFTTLAPAPETDPPAVVRPRGQCADSRLIE